MPVLQLSLSNDDELVKAIAAAIKPKITDEVKRSLEKEKPQQEWAKLAEVQDSLFAGHSRTWIQDNIIQRFPEVQLENNRHGWIKQVYGRGSVTRIYVPRAKQWLRDHFDDIDWASK